MIMFVLEVSGFVILGNNVEDKDMPRNSEECMNWRENDWQFNQAFLPLSTGVVGGSDCGFGFLHLYAFRLFFLFYCFPTVYFPSSLHPPCFQRSIDMLQQALENDVNFSWQDT